MIRPLLIVAGKPHTEAGGLKKKTNTNKISDTKWLQFYFIYFRDVRETWIRAKYIDKAFVSRPNLSMDATGKKHIRKWSVRKPHRRQRKSYERKSNSNSSNSNYATAKSTANGGGSPEKPNSSGSSAPKDTNESTTALNESKTTNDDTNSDAESFQSLQSKETSSASDQEGVLVFGSDLPPCHTDLVPSQMEELEDESADEPDLKDIGMCNVWPK